ncbi:MAG: glycosyl transferase family 1 [Acidobacteriota bacterium]|nr:glycosyl transferase family 1 [Acidobacteriota bacterium]
MAHFGIICPPVSGHLDPLAAVGRALLRRGHRVTVFQVRDLEAKVRSHTLEFASVGDDDFPGGTLQTSVAKLSALKGTASLKYAIECACAISTAILKDGPGVVGRAAVDVLLVDQNEPAGATVAEHLKLPFLSACTSLPLNREPLIPPPFVAWFYSRSLFARLRNAAGYAVSDRFIAPIQRLLNQYRSQWGLSRLKSPDDSFSQFAQIAQVPREFDFPRAALPRNFHYLGPWFDDHSSQVPFPFEKLDGRPLIYGSIGTLQQEQSHLFRIMAEACLNLNAQLVLSLGHPGTQATHNLPGEPLVVSYAPQIELLKRAALTITHSGMNTTQQSLYYGVPMVAIPLAHDQPAIASRLARIGAGIVISPSKLTVPRLRTAIQKLLPADSSFRTQANSLGESSRKAGGAEVAAGLAEQFIRRS